MEKMGRTAENVIKDLVVGILEDIEALKKEPKNDVNFGKMLAYFECLSRLQGEAIGYEEQFVLTFALYKFYRMMSTLKLSVTNPNSFITMLTPKD